jgi:hypothetical protein
MVGDANIRDSGLWIWIEVSPDADPAFLLYPGTDLNPQSHGFHTAS